MGTHIPILDFHRIMVVTLLLFHYSIIKIKFQFIELINDVISQRLIGINVHGIETYDTFM